MESFRKMEKKRIWQVVIFLALEIVILGGYFVGAKWAKEEGRRNAISELSADTDYNFLWEIAKVELKKEKVEFFGWAFYPETTNKAIAIMLCEMNGTREHIAFGELTEENEVTDYFFAGNKEKQVGFCAEIKEAELDKEKCYEIFIVLSYEKRQNEEVVEKEKKFVTNQYYYAGEIYNYNPIGFEQPNIVDEELIRVLNKGVLRGYDSDAGIWIYQQESKVYCIVDSNKYSICEGSNVLIPVMPKTLRVDLLPEERRQYGSDHLGAYYADERYQVAEIYPYQVMEIELPTEYPITYLETGLYDNNQKRWIRNFMIPMFDWRKFEAK